MFTKEALQHLQLSEAIKEATEATIGSMQRSDGIVALPENFKVADLEKYMPHRRQMRMNVTTVSLESFLNYVKSAGVPGVPTDGAAVFVAAKSMEALAIMDLGSGDQPGHCLHKVRFVAQKSDLYAEILEITANSLNKPISQSELAEFLEDFAPSVASMTGSSGEDISTKSAIFAIRNLTIDKAAKELSVEDKLSASRSSFESVTASGSPGSILPCIIHFNDQAYEGLDLVTISLRVSVVLRDGQKPAFKLSIIRHQAMLNDVAEGLHNTISNELDGTGIRVFVGDAST